jgi:beta-mannosidase
LHGDQEVQHLMVPFALRAVRLLQEKDRDGRSFVFEINGRKVFCKGADWIPGDNFLPRMSEDKCRRLLGMAREANMNMVRVWGGGVYEDDFFYSECDRLGLMVWQDFMYACAEYPDEPWFTKGATIEAQQTVRRLRNHPSVVLWCGNNECEWNYCTQHPGMKPDDMHGALIFGKILPRVCSEEDGSRPYWRSSPFGPGFPNAEASGNHHQWEVWSAWKDYPEYRKDTARFVTEFGFQAPAHAATWREVLEPRDHHPQSPVMEHHNKQVDGTERLFRFQAAHYKTSDGFSDFVYQGQLVQAEALKCAVEHWRRRKWRTAGTLFWQLNDCWPVSSWAVIDSGLRPKAAYFYAKKFFAPVLLSLRQEPHGTEVWLTSDRHRALTGALALSIRSFGGDVLWTHSRAVRLGAQASTCVYRIGSAEVQPEDRRTTYILAQLKDGDDIMAENRLFFYEPKHLVLPIPSLDLTIRTTGPDMHSVVIASDMLARNVELDNPEGDIDVDDNFFDVDAGAEKTVQVKSHLSSDELRRSLKVRWLR